jgi:hypothetical protein
MDVWFREDVARVVRAARLAGQAATDGLGWEEAEVLPAPGPQAQVSREMAAYWRGYAAALGTIGAAFGLSGEAADEKPQRASGWGSGPTAADEEPQGVSGWWNGGRP